MFRAVRRSSSGALTVFAASGLHTHVVTGRSQVWVPTQTSLRPVTTCVCKPEVANTVELLMMSGMPSKRAEPSMNGGIINSVTRLHLVGYLYWICLTFYVVRATSAAFGLHVGVMKYNEHIKESITYMYNCTNKFTCVFFYTMKDQNGKSWSCSQAVSKPVWHIPLLYLQWKTPDDGHRNCPKHVEFPSKINLRN